MKRNEDEWDDRTTEISRGSTSSSIQLHQNLGEPELYKARHLIENFFAKLKQYRAIATCYDKLAETFLCAIYMVAAVNWLN